MRIITYTIKVQFEDNDYIDPEIIAEAVEEVLNIGKDDPRNVIIGFRSKQL